MNDDDFIVRTSKSQSETRDRLYLPIESGFHKGIVKVAASLLAGAIAITASAQVELTGVAKVVAGGVHSCALTAGGGVKCWGDNSYAQIGDNSFNGRLMATAVSGLASKVVAISSGATSSCALTTAGGVMCWGDVDIIFAGINKTPLAPTNVSGLTSGVVSVSVGQSYACALTSVGGVKCWGANFYGQLGDNSTATRTTPADVFGMNNNATAVSAGARHACAITTSRTVKCWGDNRSGQLGDGSTTARLIPVDVGLAEPVSAIAAGSSHTCALTVSGGVKCWGSNDYGALGNGGTGVRLTPVDVVGLSSGVMSIAVGYNQSCALTSTGGMKCWGFTGRDQFSSNATRLTAVDVQLGSAASGIAVGGSGSASTSHVCAVVSGGAVKCLGPNHYGQLGDNTTFDRQDAAAVLEIPVDTATLSGAITPLSPLVSGRPLNITALIKMRVPVGTITITENGTALTNCSARPVTLVPSASDTAAVACTVTPTASGAKQYVITYAYPANHESGRTSEQATVGATVVAQGPEDYTDMWWAGPAENGWGLSITQHGPVQFNVIYAYDSAGKPVWYVMPGGTWNGALNTFSGALYSPTSSPFSAYDKSQFQAGLSVGNATISYSSAAAATLNFTINGISGSKNMQRQIYAADDGQPKIQVNDLWWAGSQEDGWGINIAQQGRQLFPVWYTYDSRGKATWFPIPGGTWSGTAFTGDIYSTLSSPWLGVPYSASSLQVSKVGTLKIDFVDQSSANMTYTVNGISQTKRIIRQPY